MCTCVFTGECRRLPATLPPGLAVFPGSEVRQDSRVFTHRVDCSATWTASQVRGTSVLNPDGHQACLLPAISPTPALQRGPAEAAWAVFICSKSRAGGEAPSKTTVLQKTPRFCQLVGLVVPTGVGGTLGLSSAKPFALQAAEPRLDGSSAGLPDSSCSQASGGSSQALWSH